jgi:hypothetical protein
LIPKSCSECASSWWSRKSPKSNSLNAATLVAHAATPSAISHFRVCISPPPTNEVIDDDAAARA